MHHHHHHHNRHHHNTIIVESKPTVKDTVIITTNQQPVFTQKPITTVTLPTTTLITPTFTKPTITTTTTTQTYTTPTYTTPTYTTPTYTTPTYTTPTYTTPTYTTPTYTTPTMTTTMPTTYPTQTYTQTPTPLTTTFDPSKHPYFRGVVGPYSKYFTDQPLLSKYNNDHKIAVINIAHNGKACTGVSAQYYIGSQNLTVKGDLHYGSVQVWGGREESVLLDIDEYIVEIFGKQSKWIDALGFKTNKGRIVEYGGSTGFFFNVAAPPGYHFAGLAGGVGEVLDYITFEVAPLPYNSTFPTTTTTTTTMGIQGTVGFGGTQQTNFTGFQPTYKPY